MSDFNQWVKSPLYLYYRQIAQARMWTKPGLKVDFSDIKLLLSLMNWEAPQT